MPSSTEPTPRPWAWEAIGPGEGDIALGGAVDPVGEFHILTPHVCESCSQRGASCLAPNTADAELIVEAVNNYDRLKKIEAAARQFVADWSDTTYDRASFAVDRDEWNVLHLRKALEGES